MSVFDPSNTVESLLASEHGADTKIDQDELKLCLELKTQVPDARPDQIIRFLRARKGDVVKAKDMLNKHFVWRNEMQLPFDPASDPELNEELHKNKLVFHGKDNEGRQLVVIRGKLLGKNTYKNMDIARKAVVHIMEHFENIIEPLGKATVFFSKIGASSKNVDTEFIRVLADVFQNNYPERLHVTHVAPAGLLLMGIWQTVKWFFDSDVRKKVNFKLDPKIFTTAVALEDLAEELGGNNPNPLAHHEFIYAKVGIASDVVDAVGSEIVQEEVVVVEGEDAKPKLNYSNITETNDTDSNVAVFGKGIDENVFAQEEEEEEEEEENNIDSTVDFGDAVAAAVEMSGGDDKNNNTNEVAVTGTMSPGEIAA